MAILDTRRGAVHVMAVSYLRREPPAAPELIARMEQRIGRTLPRPYRDYLLHQDGGRLTGNHEAVNTVFGLGDVPAWANMWAKLDVYHERVPSWLLPVANDEYGNLLAISLRDEDLGAVWFWDHEAEADEGELPTEDNLELKAADWSTFLDALRPV
jgi:cell wall assembly regulator SMI1